jgi:hypothetical protein
MEGLEGSDLGDRGLVVQGACSNVSAHTSRQPASASALVLAPLLIQGCGLRVAGCVWWGSKVGGGDREA